MSFVILGLGAFDEALSRVSGNLSEGSKNAIAKGAALIEAKAKANAAGSPGPEVETGTLRRGIRHTKVHRVGLVGWQSEVGPSVIYSRRIELGFQGEDALGRIYNQEARPYFTPAWNSEIGHIARLYAEEWSRALTRL